MDVTGSLLVAQGNAARRSPTGHMPGQRDRHVAPTSGPILFARYAFGPNRLGLCGPEDWRALLELSVAGTERSPEGVEPPVALDVDRGLRDLAAGFEGAIPYLELIARSAGIEDVLDPRIVDAYWIGNSLSDQVDAGLMARSMDDRFREQLGPASWRWLVDKPAMGARPTHAFHVFDVFPRVGLARGSEVTDSMALMDSCRIRWGRVLDIDGDQLVVDVEPVEMTDGKLRLGAPRSQTARGWLDGAGFVSEVSVGDVVSLHWDWACEVLDPSRLAALQRRTRHQLRIANQTI